MWRGLADTVTVLQVCTVCSGFRGSCPVAWITPVRFRGASRIPWEKRSKASRIHVSDTEETRRRKMDRAVPSLLVAWYYYVNSWTGWICVLTSWKVRSCWESSFLWWWGTLCDDRGLMHASTVYSLMLFKVNFGLGCIEFYVKKILLVMIRSSGKIGFVFLYIILFNNVIRDVNLFQSWGLTN